MKRTTLVTAAVAVWWMVGCGQPAPDGTVVGQGGDSGGIVGDTVNIDESRYGENNGLENSSADGFQSVYFDFDRYNLAPEMERVVARNAINAEQKSGRIRIEGNCDEFGTDEYNYALGLRRAKTVKEAMVAQGVLPQRLVLVSYGESNPVCSEQTERCYQRNRRVDLRLAR